MGRLPEGGVPRRRRGDLGVAPSRVDRSVRVRGSVGICRADLRHSADTVVFHVATAAHAQPDDMTMRGTASELVLFVYDRVPLDGLQITGDIEPLEQLAGWDPNA